MFWFLKIIYPHLLVIPLCYSHSTVSSMGFLWYRGVNVSFTWIVFADFRTFRKCWNSVGYAWMLQSSLTIHFKNITPAEILFCPQNLHWSSSHSDAIPGGSSPYPIPCDRRRLHVLAASKSDSTPRDSDTAGLRTCVFQGLR